MSVTVHSRWDITCLQKFWNIREEQIKISNLHQDQTLQKVPCLQLHQGVRQYPALQVGQRGQSLHGLHGDHPYQRLQRSQGVQRCPKRFQGSVSIQLFSPSTKMIKSPILTAGPGVPILPAAPGKPVRPCDTQPMVVISESKQLKVKHLFHESDLKMWYSQQVQCLHGHQRVQKHQQDPGIMKT